MGEGKEERKFITMEHKDMYVTKEGLAELKAELKDLQEVKRPLLVERIESARSQGDLSENSEYQQAQEDLTFLDGRIEELGDLIRDAKIIRETNGKATSVKLGSSVTVKVNGKNDKYDVVGAWEADPMMKKISHESPLGVALLDKKPGDEVIVEAPAGKIVYTIVSVE